MKLMNLKIVKFKKLTYLIKYKIQKNTRIPCYAHSLQIVVNQCMKSDEINIIASKLKSLTHKINKSTTLISYLKKLRGSKPPGYCPTRYLSLYLVLNWYFKNENYIKKFCEDNSLDHLSVTQWSRVNQIIKLLKPFAIYTKYQL